MYYLKEKYEGTQRRSLLWQVENEISTAVVFGLIRQGRKFNHLGQSHGSGYHFE